MGIFKRSTILADGFALKQRQYSTFVRYDLFGYSSRPSRIEVSLGKAQHKGKVWRQETYFDAWNSEGRASMFRSIS